MKLYSKGREYGIYLDNRVEYGVISRHLILSTKLASFFAEACNGFYSFSIVTSKFNIAFQEGAIHAGSGLMSSFYMRVLPRRK